MAKYEMLIAASGKRGSALLPCVVVDEKGIKRAAVRAKAMARACYPEYEKFNVVKIYQMPNDQRALVLARGMSDERPEKFAGNGKKPVRRGGS